MGAQPGSFPVRLVADAETAASVDEQVKRAYLPHKGVISLVVKLARGEHVQVAMIGRDSIFGSLAALGDSIALSSAVVLVPLGFVMGMPFPAGLKLLSGSGQSTIEWAWAMNASASVLGSVSAMVIAIHFGLTVTLVCAAVAYAVAALARKPFAIQ